MVQATVTFDPRAFLDKRPGPAAKQAGEPSRGLALGNGSRVAVVGGGPAGSFFSYFLLDMAQTAGLDLHLDIFEPRNFSAFGPAGCNMCGGIISESLVQTLAADGISLPTTVVERGIDAYVLHMEEGKVRIDTPLNEKRIAAVHRGAGPRGLKEAKWRSFDGYLLELATGKGAEVVRARVDGVSVVDGRPLVTARGVEPKAYDLLVVATGVNTSSLKLLEGLGWGYASPGTTKTYITELYLGVETVEEHLGSAMHVFLLNLPRLEFAALIPKGEYATLCILGRDIDGALVQSLLDSPQVRECLPAGWTVPKDCCHCAPQINVRAARKPYADRVVFIGDAGVTRLYKDGIGAAYRTGKAAAFTAIFKGISAADFRRGFWPVCRSINTDNTFGKLIFAVSHEQQRWKHDRVGILRMVAREQRNGGRTRRMSTVMWDVFTGSAPYRDVFTRTLDPRFIGRLVWEVLAGLAVGVGGAGAAAR